jgi:hypothetical protein
MVVAAELREGMVIRFSDVAEARVVETAPPAHSQQGSAWKEVTLEIGLSIRVPLFITPGGRAGRSKDGRYIERARTERKRNTSGVILPCTSGGQSHA